MEAQRRLAFEQQIAKNATVLCDQEAGIAYLAEVNASLRQDQDPDPAALPRDPSAGGTPPRGAR